VAYGATRQAANLIFGSDEGFVINDVVPLTLGTEIRVIKDSNWLVRFFREPQASKKM